MTVQVLVLVLVLVLVMKFLIDGPTTIQGTIAVAGAKNAALPLLAASVVLDGALTIERVPDIEDVRRMVEIAAAIGIRVDASTPGSLTVDGTACASHDLPAALTARLRASVIFLGPLLARFGAATLPQPGGCMIGRRPIDLFMDGFRAFGFEAVEEPTVMRFAGRARASRYVFPVVSVTGTEALLLLAVRALGTSVIANAAMEPEVTALAEFLNASGADITGIGSPTLTVRGVDTLAGGRVRCIPDRIETGAFASLVAACGGELAITDANPRHVEVLLALLGQMGATIDVDPEARTIRITATPPLRAVSFRTHEHPGLATDAQPPLTVALTQARGIALVHETIYEGRLFFIDKLNAMGANVILCDPHRCIVDGPRQLHGARLESPDIRAGIALLIAAAAAHGRSTVENVYQIDRGFERIEERLRGIGVRITREP